MPGIVPTFTEGPTTYQVSATVIGGQLVEYDGGGTGLIRVGTAGSLVCVGVALGDAAPTSASASSVDAWGNTLLQTQLPQAYVAVAKLGSVKVTYAAITTLGQALICAASGQVTPAGAAPDARTLVGVCDEPLGVGAAGVGKMRVGQFV